MKGSGIDVDTSTNIEKKRILRREKSEEKRKKERMLILTRPLVLVVVKTSHFTATRWAEKITAV